MIKKYSNNIDIEREIAEQKLIIKNAEKRISELKKKLHNNNDLVVTYVKDETLYNGIKVEEIMKYVLDTK